jgi:hypothetical protein
MIEHRPRHSKRHVKPTERGSQLPFMLAKQRHARMSTSSSSLSERSRTPFTPSPSLRLGPSQAALFAQNREIQAAAKVMPMADLGEDTTDSVQSTSPLFEPESPRTEVEEVEPIEESSDLGEVGGCKGDSSTADEDYICDMPRVNFIARWRVTSSKESLPRLETTRESSRNITLNFLFG